MGRRRSDRMRAGYALYLIFAPVVLPLERLQVAQIVATPLGHGDDVINFPAVTAPRISEVLPDDGPAPGIHTQRFVDAHGSCLLPDGFDNLRAERIAIGICVRLSLHDWTLLICMIGPTVGSVLARVARSAPGKPNRTFYLSRQALRDVAMPEIADLDSVIAPRDNAEG